MKKEGRILLMNEWDRLHKKMVFKYGIIEVDGKEFSVDRFEMSEEISNIMEWREDMRNQLAYSHQSTGKHIRWYRRPDIPLINVPADCPKCGGLGELVEDDDGDRYWTCDCKKCEGSGQIIEKRCSKCNDLEEECRCE